MPKRSKKRTGWGAKSGLTYQQSPQWRKIRLDVLKRDGFRCRAINAVTGERCTAKATDVDHINGPSNDLSNLAALCGHHHRRKTSAETARKNRESLQRLRRMSGQTVRGLGGREILRKDAPIGARIDWSKYKASGKLGSAIGRVTESD